MHSRELLLADEAATLRCGGAFAAAGLSSGIVYLEGDLGAGKTAWVRGFLRAAGVAGEVPSPTFTLVEPYRTETVRALHLDLYRLADPEELEYLGLRDELADDCLWLVEWPERGRGFLPAPTLRLTFHYQGAGRRLRCEAYDTRSAQLLDRVNC